MALDAGDLDLFRRSVLVHELAAGQGCAELFRSDAGTSAMLLERLGPNLHDLAMPVPAVLDAVVTTLRSFWRPVADDCDLPTGADQAKWLAGHISTTWEDLGRPCAQEVIDRALLYCEERASAFDPTDTVLVHGDAHGWNTLSAAGGTFKFVDPEGLRSTRAHDLSVPMREYNEPLLAGDTARLVRERAALLRGAGRGRARAGLAVGLHRAGVDRARQPPRLRGRRRSSVPRGRSPLSLRWRSGLGGQSGRSVQSGSAR